MMLDRKEDMVIGAITGYEWKDIEPFVVSLDKSGYSGHKAMIVYECNKELVEELEKREWILFGHQSDGDGGTTYQNKDFNICVDRFYHYWAFLNPIKNNIRNIYAFDVKDVIFQGNPSDAIDIDQSDECVLVSYEGLNYGDEPWGWNNMQLSFGPEISMIMAKQEIINAGVLAGTAESMISLFLNVFLYSRGAPYKVPGGGGPDQAALNVWLRNNWNSIPVLQKDNWACQAGTMADPNKIDEFRSKLLCDEPVWDGEKVLTKQGIPYTIVHQYDRVPEWKNVIDMLYRE